MPTSPERSSELAGELRSVVGAVVRRFRRDRSVPQPQVSVLNTLERKGPMTTSELAAVDHVRPQSMASTVAQLEEAGHVERRPDATDGRKQQVALTAAGRDAVRALRAAGESWLAAAIDERLTADEREELGRATRLLARLVDDD